MSNNSVGTVKSFDKAKGYGYLLSDNSDELFIRFQSIQQEGYKTLSEGQQVEYLQVKSDKGWQAAEVSSV